MGIGVYWGEYCMVCLEKSKLGFLELASMVEIVLWCPLLGQDWQDKSGIILERGQNKGRDSSGFWIGRASWYLEVWQRNHRR